jgi:hypothetical protein
MQKESGDGNEIEIKSELTRFERRYERKNQAMERSQTGDSITEEDEK